MQKDKHRTNDSWIEVWSTRIHHSNGLERPYPIYPRTKYSATAKGRASASKAAEKHILATNLIRPVSDYRLHVISREIDFQPAQQDEQLSSEQYVYLAQYRCILKNDPVGAQFHTLESIEILGPKDNKEADEEAFALARKKILEHDRRSGYDMALSGYVYEYRIVKRRTILLETEIENIKVNRDVSIERVIESKK